MAISKKDLNIVMCAVKEHASEMTLRASIDAPEGKYGEYCIYLAMNMILAGVAEIDKGDE